MKYKLLLVGSILGLGAASAVNAETIESALSKCSAQKNSLQRLVCYDRVVKDINQYSGLEDSLTRRSTMPKATGTPVQPSPGAATPKREQQEQAQQGTRFGMEHLEDNNTEADTMTAVISSVSTTLRDQYVVTLENGTVWQQTDNQRLTLKPGQKVTIDRGVFSAFYLSHPDVSKRIKVKRIK